VRKAIGLLLLFGSARIFADTVTVVGPATPPNVGDTFEVDITSDLYAFQMDLTFDPTLLSAVSVTEGPFLPSGGSTFFVPGTIDNVGGSVTATADSLVGPIPGVTGNGVLLQFQFTAIAPGASALNIANPFLLDSGLNDITANSTFQNGSVTISPASSSAAPEPGYLALCAGLLLLIVFRKVYVAWRLAYSHICQDSVTGRA
jgi:hypothetical protein